METADVSTDSQTPHTKSAREVSLELFFFPTVSKCSSAVKKCVCNLHMRLFLDERRTTHGQSMFSSFNAAINIWEVNEHPVVFPIRLFNKNISKFSGKGTIRRFGDSI